jgi:hypothetical protein
MMFSTCISFGRPEAADATCRDQQQHWRLELAGDCAAVRWLSGWRRRLLAGLTISGQAACSQV